MSPQHITPAIPILHTTTPTPFYPMSSYYEPDILNITLQEESEDHGQEGGHPIADQAFFQQPQQIFMRFTTKGLNKTNSVKFASYLNTIYASLSVNVTHFRKLLKMEQAYSRLTKNIAKKRAILKLLNKSIIEDEQHLQHLGMCYIKKLKRARLSCFQNNKCTANRGGLVDERALETWLMADTAAKRSQRPSPARLDCASTSLAGTVQDDDHALLPGHLIYLLAISVFTCVLCINQFSGGDIYILDCCRQHICVKCYIKCKANPCPFCRQEAMTALNFFPRIDTVRHRQPFRCIFSKDADFISQADDFDDVSDIYDASAANDFANKHLEAMARHYDFLHI